MMEAGPIIEVNDLRKHFSIRKGILLKTAGQVRAVDGVSFHILPGETLALVGESGCGKSTIGRTILKLIEPSGGTIRVDGQDITRLPPRRMHPYRRHLQIIFQDPYASLTPTMRIGEILGEPLANYGLAARGRRQEQAARLLRRVGLRPEDIERFPHEFSGGQRQRIAIARALALEPKLIVCDEPVSALDVSVRAQVLNLLAELQEELGLSYLFISHDLAVVEHISHRIAVMYLGKIVELAVTGELFASPLHPYTEALLSAVPVPDPEASRKGRILLAGDIPSPSNPPSGCRFRTRCPLAAEECSRSEPPLREVRPSHLAACHFR